MKQLNGYRASHKNKWFLVTQKILTLQEFLLFEYYLDLMDFDKSHGDKFALFEVFLNEVAPIFNRTEDSIRGWHNSLQEKGFIKIVDEKRNLYTVKSPLRYVVGLSQWGGEASRYTKEEKDQPQEFILENIRFSQPAAEKFQQKPVKNTDKSTNAPKNSLISSKGDSLVPSLGSHKVVVIRQTVRSDAEYQKICADGGFEKLTPDDMRWIDENTTERILIESDEQEQEIVDLYFHSNRDEFQKGLLTG